MWITKDRLYKLLTSIKQRCYNPKHNHYKFYGAKGIKVCDEWLNDFFKFKKWALANGYDYNAPKGQYTIDRIDANGNYEPNNCRFITITENVKRAKKKDGKLYTYNNETHDIKEWAKKLNLHPATLWERLRKGLHYEKVFTSEVNKNNMWRKDTRIKTIVRIDIKTNEVKRYNNLSEIRKDGFSTSNIPACCNGYKNSYKGYKWKYEYSEVLKNETKIK